MRDAVLEHFGVPREIMGITENSNRATADSAQYIYAKNVLMPRVKNREEAINEQLLPLFGDGLIWRYDAIIPYDKEFDKGKALDGYRTGLLTKNEARRLLDMPDVEDGDGFVELNGGVPLNNLEPLKSLRFSGRKATRPPDISTLLREEQAVVQKNVALFEAAITRHFSDQRSEIEGLSALPDALETFISPDGSFDPELWSLLDENEQKSLADSAADNILDWNGEARKLNDLFSPLWEKAYNDGLEINRKHYALKEFDRPAFVSPVQINGGERVAGIEHTTRNSIANLIIAGIANGSPSGELKALICSEMRIEQSRANLIALQETLIALAAGEYNVMRAAGARTKTWHHTPQENPRDGTNGKSNHIALEGETALINAKFSNGLRYPRDPKDPRPEEIINCKCYLTYGGFQ